MKEVEKKLNDLALCKFQLSSEFLALNRQVESVLGNYRLNLSRTRAIIGLSMVGTAVIDNREMEPSVWIEIDSAGTFSLMTNHATHSETKASSTEQPPVRQFRPFGILEPPSAKAARRDVTKAIELICDLASTKCKLQEVIEEYSKLKETLAVVA